jgi:hypothetical protein
MDNNIQKLIDRASQESKGILVLNTPQQLKDFYNEHLEKYTQWRAIASIEDWLPIDNDFLQNFRMQLGEKGVDTRVIFKKEGLKYEQLRMKNRRVKVVPDAYSFKSSIDILDDKILIMNPHQTVLGLVIESSVLVDVFIDMFDIMWDVLPNITNE